MSKEIKIKYSVRFGKLPLSHQHHRPNGNVCLGAQNQDGNIVDVSNVAKDLKTLIQGGQELANKVTAASQNGAG